MRGRKGLAARQSQQTIELEEKDPDTLQILDEIDKEWLNQWKNMVRKKDSETKMLTVFVASSKVTQTLHKQVNAK